MGLHITEAEQAFTMPRDENRTRVNYYLAWARTYLKRGDALNNSKRGVWALTEKGSAISDLSATQAIYDQVTQEERERARLKRLAAKKAAANSGEEIEIMADDGPNCRNRLTDRSFGKDMDHQLGQLDYPCFCPRLVPSEFRSRCVSHE